jgi:hypothetical protein
VGHETPGAPGEIVLALALALVLTGSPPSEDHRRGDPTTEPDAAPESPRPPAPDRAHGVARPHRAGARQLLWIPRVVLYLPRRALELALSPVRAALWAYERYDLDGRFRRVFFFDGRRTFGLYPSARFESSFGGSVGMRLVHRDLFGRGGSLAATGSFGGVYGQRFRLDANSRRLGGEPVRLGITTEYRMLPADRFYGIGNGDFVPEPPRGTRIDPRGRAAAVGTRFEHEYWRLGASLGVRVRPHVRLILSSTFTWRRFGQPARERTIGIADVYLTRALVGYDTGITNFYDQLRLEVDTRARAQTPAMPYGGWLAAFYGGHTIGVGDDPSNFGRLGIDVQRFVDLWRGTRLLRLRGVLEGTIAPRDRIPFVELPTLGGPYFLRGYPRGRFRDRVAGFATIEYSWEIADFMAGFLFIEPGRVWSGTLPVDRTPVRMGFGGGVQIHTRRMFIGRIQLASSIDGGFGVDLNFAPATRWRDVR